MTYSKIKIYLSIDNLNHSNVESYLDDINYDGNYETLIRRDNSMALKICFNDKAEGYVSDMIRKGLKNLLNTPELIKKTNEKYHAEAYLIIIPHLVDEEEIINPSLSLDDDIIEWLYKSKVHMDLDVYLA